MKKYRLLGNIGNNATHIVLGDISYVLTVYFNRSGRNVIES